MYSSDAFGTYAARHEGKSDISWYHRKFLRLFDAGSCPLLLDVGCGDGSFLLTAQRSGFEVWGADFDEKSVEAARRSGLANVYPKSLNEFVEFANLNGKRFDAVTFFEVIEHQEDPLGFLRQIRAVLASHGLIAGSVPNRNRFCVSLERLQNPADFPPHHFTWWSKDALHFALSNAGFQEISIDSESRYNSEETASWWATVFSGLIARRIKNTSGNELSSIAHKSILLRLLARRLFYPLGYVSQYVFNSKGDKLFFTARRS